MRKIVQEIRRLVTRPWVIMEVCGGQDLVNKVFEVCDRKWRGGGSIPKSGYKLRYEFRDHDAERLFEVEEIDTQESSLCISGLVLQA